MVTRRLLPSQSLAELATAERFGLPPRFRAPFVPDEDREQIRAAAREALTAAGATQSDGSTDADLATALRPLASPSLVVEIDVTAPHPPEKDVDHDPSTRAAAWTACLAGDAAQLVVLLRRDVLPVVELSTCSLAELSAELRRLLAELPPGLPAHGRSDMVVPLELITLLDGARRTGGQPESVAALTGADPRQVRDVLSVLRDVDAALQVRVSALAPGSVTAGAVLWYRTSSGWWQLDAAPTAGAGQRLARLTPVEVEDAHAAVVPLLALALPLQVQP